MTDPELAGDLPERSKSQGISEVEDGTLVIRAKFKAKAGKQLMIRRAALTAVHRAFQENGIRAVPKPLTSVHCSASHLITPARSTSFNPTRSGWRVGTPDPIHRSSFPEP